MGNIFALSGPSGVGKTTFLQELFGSPGVGSTLGLIPRYTDRPRREDEEEGFEYYFSSHSSLLQKVFASDFIHFEKWGDYYSAIETRSLEEVLESDADGIVLASVSGSSRLSATYGSRIIPIYLWTGTRLSLMDPRCLEESSPEIRELMWRINKKINDNGFSEFETDSLSDGAFTEKRMVDNFVDVAAANGRLRAGEVLHVITNSRDQLPLAISDFLSLNSPNNSLIERRG